MNELGLLAVCLLRAQEGVSAQEMQKDIDKVSFKQKKRKYLDKLLEMGAILMTIPDKPPVKIRNTFFQILEMTLSISNNGTINVVARK